MRGNTIVVSTNGSPRGVFSEGWLASGQSVKPGMIVQVDPTVALKGGRFTYKIYDRAADGDRPYGPLYIVREHPLFGCDYTFDNSASAGVRLFLYTPIAGEEVNVLLLDIAGTADDHPAGEELMIDDGTGKCIVTTGTPQSNPFVLLETVTDPLADTLVWVLYGNH